jgi:hypothetical protein
MMTSKEDYAITVWDFGNYERKNILIEVQDVKTGRQLFLKSYTDPKEARTDYEEILKSDNVERWKSESFFFGEHLDKIIVCNKKTFPENFTTLGKAMFSESVNDARRGIKNIKEKKYEIFLERCFEYFGNKYCNKVTNAPIISMDLYGILCSTIGEMVIRAFVEEDEIESYRDEVQKKHHELLRRIKLASKEILEKRATIPKKTAGKRDDSLGMCPHCGENMQKSNDEWYCLTCMHRT